MKMNYANDWAPNPEPSANPYAAPVSMIDDDYGAEYKPWAHRALATRLQRLAANMVDGGTYLGVVLPWIIAMVLAETAGGQGAVFYGMIAIGLVLFLGLVTYNLMRLHAHQQTIGKQVVGIQIIRADLQTPVTLGRIIGLRILPISLLGAIPFVGGLIGLADPVMIFQESQQCLHDMIADTNVVVFEA